jgi:hypothetical protein
LPNRVEQLVQGTTGVDRAHIAGDVEQIMGQSQKAAKPYYDAYEKLGPMSSATLEEVLTKPHIQDALRTALRNAKNEGAPAHDIEVLQQLVDGLPTDAGPKGEAASASYLPQAQEYLQARHVRQALKKQLGPSLTDFIASKGGLNDAGGEIAAMDGDIAHKGTPFKRMLVKPNGRGLDDAAVSAWEAGYFPDRTVPPEPGEFLDAIRRDLAGQKTYAKTEGEAGALATRIENFDAQLARYGIDPTGKSAKQIADELASVEALTNSYQGLAENGSVSAPPETETVSKAVPTPRVLNDTKKVLDKDYIKREMKAEVQGADPEDWSKNNAYIAFKQEVASLAKSSGFDYDMMQRIGGEAPKVRQAFVNGQRLVEGNDYRSLLAATKDMSDPERKAALGGFVKSVIDQMTAKQKFDPSKLRLYATDDFAARIGYLSGNVERGKAFQKGMQDIIRERAGLRMRPGTNSVTGEIAQGNAELDAMTGSVDLKKVPKSKTDVLNLAADQANKLLDRVAAGFSDEQRNELGRMLIDPEYARQALEDLATYRKTRGAGAIIRRAARTTAPFAPVTARSAGGVNALGDMYQRRKPAK